MITVDCVSRKYKSKQIVRSAQIKTKQHTHDLMCGKLSSSFPPVFLKICNAASATFSSSIFRQPSRDSNVSAEWKDTGWVKDKTWGHGTLVRLFWSKMIEYKLLHWANQTAREEVV